MFAGGGGGGGSGKGEREGGAVKYFDLWRGKSGALVFCHILTNRGMGGRWVDFSFLLRYNTWETFAGRGGKCLGKEKGKGKGKERKGKRK